MDASIGQSEWIEAHLGRLAPAAYRHSVERRPEQPIGFLPDRVLASAQLLGDCFDGNFAPGAAEQTTLVVLPLWKAGHDNASTDRVERESERE